MKTHSRAIRVLLLTTILVIAAAACVGTGQAPTRYAVLESSRFT